MALEDLFPGLATSSYVITSPATSRYNCLAWAGGDTEKWWEPDPDGDCYWPEGAPRERTLEAVTKAYESLGFVPCQGDHLEPATEKLAVFARGALPTHIARQRPDGRWTSKLGPLEDIEHILDGLVGTEYGSVVLIMKRATASS